MFTSQRGLRSRAAIQLLRVRLPWGRLRFDAAHCTHEWARWQLRSFFAKGIRVCVHAQVHKCLSIFNAQQTHLFLSIAVIYALTTTGGLLRISGTVACCIYSLRLQLEGAREQERKTLVSCAVTTGQCGARCYSNAPCDCAHARYYALNTRCKRRSQATQRAACSLHLHRSLYDLPHVLTAAVATFAAVAHNGCEKAGTGRQLLIYFDSATAHALAAHAPATRLLYRGAQARSLTQTPPICERLPEV